MKIKALIIGVLFGITVSANADPASMQEVFDQINARGNVTQPTAIQGQTMNYMTGGSLFMRTPNTTYNLAAITPPSTNAGCGGIDLYMGGFSFVNKEQFVAMLKNIGSNALGYGFKLALQNLCPTCDNVLQALQSASQQINRMNIDSCEAAKGIVNAATSTVALRGREQSSMNFGTIKNIFSDMTEAWTKNKGNSQQTNQTLDNLSNQDPNMKNHIPDGNLTWKALSKISALPTDQKYLIMAMVGTVVITEDPTNGTPKIVAYPRRIDNISTLIGTSASSQAQFPVWRCVDGTREDECTSLVQDNLTTNETFYSLVDEKMRLLADAISQRRPITDAGGIIQFINLTDIPIYKIIALNTRYGGDSTAAMMALDQYKELIAAKYALAYFEITSKMVEAALGNIIAGTADAVTAQEVTKIRETLDKTRADLNQSTQVAYARSNVSFNIAQEVQHMERTLHSNLAPALRQSIVFANTLDK